MVKIAEGQSRYGIIKELTENKIRVIETIARMENELQNFVVRRTQEIGDAEKNIAERTACYEIEFQNFKKMCAHDIERIKLDTEQKIRDIQAKVANKEATYQEEFQTGLLERKKNLDALKAELERVREHYAAQTQNQKTILSEIDKSLENIKEAGKESKKE